MAQALSVGNGRRPEVHLEHVGHGLWPRVGCPARQHQKCFSAGGCGRGWGPGGVGLWCWYGDRLRFLSANLSNLWKYAFAQPTSILPGLAECPTPTTRELRWWCFSQHTYSLMVTWTQTPPFSVEKRPRKTEMQQEDWSWLFHCICAGLLTPLGRDITNFATPGCKSNAKVMGHITDQLVTLGVGEGNELLWTSSPTLPFWSAWRGAGRRIPY